MVTAVAAGMLAGIGAVVADPDRALTVSATYVPGLSAAAAQASAKATLTATLPLWTGAGRHGGRPPRRRAVGCDG